MPEPDECHVVLFTRKEITHTSRVQPSRQAAEDLADELRKDRYVSEAQVVPLAALVEDCR